MNYANVKTAILQEFADVTDLGTRYADDQIALFAGDRDGVQVFFMYVADSDMLHETDECGDIITSHQL